MSCRSIQSRIRSPERVALDPYQLHVLIILYKFSKTKRTRINDIFAFAQNHKHKNRITIMKVQKKKLTTSDFNVGSSRTILYEFPVVRSLKRVALFAVFSSSAAPAFWVREAGEIKLILKSHSFNFLIKKSWIFDGYKVIIAESANRGFASNFF